MSSSDFSAFALFTAGLAAFAPAVSALIVPGGSNPTAGAVFTPDGTSKVTAGQSFKVTWNATTAGCGDKVDLVLLYGPSSSQMNAQSYIVQSTDNSGSYDWTPSTSLTATDDTNKYGIELICDQTQAYQYTTRFSLDNSNPTSSSASGSASGSTTASGSASSSASVSSSTTSVKYPTGNSTTTAVTGGVTSTGTATVTHTASGSKTTGGATSTGSSTSSSGSASATGNAADHMKAGFGGLLAAAAVVVFAL